MTVQQFEGASAIVSGGAGGLGEAAVRRLHADGLANVPFPKRLGAPAEFADAAAFLLTNGYVNGEVLRPDGGQRFAPK